MTEAEATEEVRYLANLYPRTNDDVLDYWRLKFLKFDKQIVHRAVIKFYDSDKSGFIDKSGLLAEIDTQSGNGPITDPAARAAAVAAEAEERRKWREHDQRKAAMSFGEIDRVLAPLSDSELDDLKAGVLKNLPELTANVLKLSNVKTGKTIRYHMAQAMRGVA